MDKSWMNCEDTYGDEFCKGVNEFIEMAKKKTNSEGKIRCPCSRCRNIPPFQDLKVVENHLRDWGMDMTYKVWVHHGEDVILEDDASNDDDDDDRNGYNELDSTDDEIDDMLHDISGGHWDDLSSAFDGGQIHSAGNAIGKFGEIFDYARKDLYLGCKRYSLLLFVVKLLHLKVLNKWSNKSVTMLLELLKDSFPEGNLLPSTYYEAKKLLADIGLGYQSIHACKNDCILFRKEYETLDLCPKCSESQWKVNDGKGKRVPQKVLRYFPLKPRLQRLYLSKKIANHMRWHKEKHVEQEGFLTHPADGEAWKDFDCRFPEFASDSRNIRLALSSDGFNPFNNMSTAYSMWPVVLINYNMPPWESRRDSHFMLSLLIPGPKSPGKDIDVYLKPLVEDLLDLWNDGVRTYDAYSGQWFKMHAALLWTISDFPAYGDLSGWVTKGKLACPICCDETSSVSLRSKIGYIGHRRFLPIDHKWRRRSYASKFNGKVEQREKPCEPSGLEKMEQLEVVKGVTLGKNPNVRKRKRSPEEKNWTKRSIFFDLPYWRFLKLPHNIDFMHTEKNWLDSIMGTLLNIVGKTKDTDKARLDLEDMGIRHPLHLRMNNGKVEKPPACYTLSQKNKNEFCEFLKKVKYPDGYAANISRCVNIKEGKISGLKSHDCHVLLQRILPIGMRSYLNKEVYTLICEVSSFFRDLGSRKLKVEDVEKLEENIVIILCKLEMIFPPAFFDAMIHMAVHLPKQARLGGPVQNRWMYPFERYLGNLKGTVKNKAHPEGSIAESYIINESLNFCSLYLNSVETKFNRRERQFEREKVQPCTFAIFYNEIQTFGAPNFGVLTMRERDILHWYVLSNCDELRPYFIEHEQELERDGESDIWTRQAQEFPLWFMKKVESLSTNAAIPEINELQKLAQGPDIRVTRYPGCFVNGVKFLTKDRDRRRKCQNSGVRVEGEHQGESADYFGVLTEILQLTYGGNKHVVMFKCEWFDSRCFQRDNFFISVDVSRKWYNDDPYILAIQASQVFYVPDTVKSKGDRWVVQSVEHRQIWDSTFFASSDEESSSDKNDEGNEYQQNECPTKIIDIEELEASQLIRENEEPEIVELQHGISSRLGRVDGDEFINDEDVEDNWDIDADQDIDEEFCSGSDTNEEF